MSVSCFNTGVRSHALHDYRTSRASERTVPLARPCPLSAEDYPAVAAPESACPLSGEDCPRRAAVASACPLSAEDCPSGGPRKCLSTLGRGLSPWRTSEVPVHSRRRPVPRWRPPKVPVHSRRRTVPQAAAVESACPLSGEDCPPRFPRSGRATATRCPGLAASRRQSCSSPPARSARGRGGHCSRPMPIRPSVR